MIDYYATANPIYYGLLKIYANENRAHQTDAEELLWYYLSNNQLGLHFRRQHIIGCYIADFVCLKKKLIVEVDGGYHSQESQIIKDYWRTDKLNSLGYQVLRFKNEEIYNNITQTLDTIFNQIAKPTLTSDKN